MNRVYIAGPISKGYLAYNVHQSDVAFKRLVENGFAPFNPMWSVFAGSVASVTSDSGNTHVYAIAKSLGGLGLTHGDWITVDLKWVEVSDCVLRLPGESVGADMEVKHAKLHNIPVFYSIEEVIQWRSSITKATKLM